MPMGEPPQLLIHRPGLLTTVQDLGRYGYQRYGVSVSGAMDRGALRIGNRLVGNPDDAAGLEITLLGPEVAFRAAAIIAVTGADLSAALNGRPLPMWTAVPVQGGDILRFGQRRSGTRAYVCLAGGIDVPLVFGSRATDLGSGLGGFEGRRLATGDVLRVRQIRRPPSKDILRPLPLESRPIYERHPVLRVLMSPQASEWSSRALETMLAQRYVVSPDSNRMGFRLAGRPLAHRMPAMLLSDATTMGTIQVPPDHQPILLMADCQPMGGYPQIASIISVDMPRAAQLAPGDEVRFTRTTTEEAQALCRAERASLDRWLPPVNFRGRRSKGAIP